jgi:hypothetical protein
MAEPVTPADKTCEGIILSGPNKGKRCDRPPEEDGHCGIHKNQILHKALLKEGKKPCNNFFRGCRIILAPDDKFTTCKECRDKKSADAGKVNNCQKVKCPFKTRDGKRFCKKHEREEVYELAQTKGIRFCSAERGCFEVLEKDQKKCDTCIDRKLRDVKESIDAARTSHKKCTNCDSKDTSKNHLCETCIPLIEKANEENTVHTISKRILREVHRDVVNGANKRKLFCNLTNEQIANIIIRPCFFCGFYSDSTFNSVDRIDNNKGYIISNVITACSTCNLMRGTNTPVEFIEKITAIKAFQETKAPVDNALIERFPKFAFLYYKQSYPRFTHRARKREIPYSLKKEDYALIIANDCYLCGIKNSEKNMNGIDRYDSFGEYSIENSRPCCLSCNLIKKTMPFPTMIQHIECVLAYCPKAKCYDISVGSGSLLKHRHEVYNADEMYQILSNSDMEAFLSWAKYIGYGPTFLESMKTINIDESKSKQLDAIQEVINAYNETFAEPVETKYITANEMLTMIQEMHEKEFAELYAKRYILSSSFQSELDKVVPLIRAEADAAKKLILCQTFIKKEKIRRNSKLTHAKTKVNRSPKSYTSGTLSIVHDEEEVVEEEIPSAEEENLLTLSPPETAVLTLSPPLPSVRVAYVAPVVAGIRIPKQWKTADVYKFIKENQEGIYKQYVIDSNKTLPDTFETDFAKLVSTVKAATSLESIKDSITDFIAGFRKARTLTLLKETAKDVVVREDREVFPAATVVRMYKEKKFEPFTVYMKTKSTEATVPTTTFDPSWARFETALKGCTKDEELLDTIKKFMSSQRVQRNRYSKPATTVSDK